MSFFHSRDKTEEEESLSVCLSKAKEYYQNGDSRAVAYCERLAKLGYTEGEYMLGCIRCYGKCGARADGKEGLRLLQCAADRGSMEAACSIGIFLRKERPREAFQWLLKSAQGGCAYGAAHLASAYSQGIGVKQDPAEAFKWYGVSARGGSEPGIRMLGILYANGEGTAPNIEKALGWLEFGAANGDEKAAAHVKELHDAGYTQTEPDFAGAQPGDQVWFGHFRQGGTGAGRPLPWIVLEADGKNALLATRGCVDAGEFDPEYSWEYGIGWTESKLQSCLNDEFLRDLADGEEQRLIVPTRHAAGLGLEEIYTDRVFVLSSDQFAEYLPLRGCGADFNACVDGGDDEEFRKAEAGRVFVKLSCPITAGEKKPASCGSLFLHPVIRVAIR